MSKSKIPSLKLLLYGLYLVLVLVVLEGYSENLGEDEGTFWFMLLLIVLVPWRFVSGIAIIGTMYHGGNQGIVTMTIITALLNVVTIHFLIRGIKLKDKKTTRTLIQVNV